MTNTIQEEYCLPSKGLIYGTPFDPTVKLRSMTVADEMKRLQKTDNGYKLMSEIIDDCLITKLPISAYDMCLGDYQYLLHKLRVVTYGPDYKLIVGCPHCGKLFDYNVDLDSLAVKEIDDSYKDDFVIKLPKAGNTVKLKFQTPRDLDWIAQRTKEIKKNFPEMTGDPTLVLNLQTMISTIDGQALNPILAYDNLKQLPAADMNYLMQKAEKLNEKVGIDIMFTAKCPECGNDVKSTFRFTSEFFRPTYD